MTMKKIPSIYNLEKTLEEETGLRLFGLVNKVNDITVWQAEFNSKFDVHSSIAWAGARTSRSADSYVDIFKEIKEAIDKSKATAGQKLAKVFVNYGHASVADMAPVMLYMNNIPIYLAFWIFNHTSVGAGQELSTRYVKLDDLGIKEPDLGKNPKIKKLWYKIQDYQKEKYEEWYPKIYDATKSYLKENTDKKVPKSTVTARSLDVVRYWIPIGAKTSMTLLTSVRNWIDLVVQLRESNFKTANELGEHIFTMLNLDGFESTKEIMADLGGLTKYSEGKFTISNSLEELESHLKNLKGYKKLVALSKINKKEENSAKVINQSNQDLFGGFMIMQYIKTLHPSLNESDILKFISNLSDDDLSKLGKIIFSDHNHHNLMRNAGDTRGVTFATKTSLAYTRDLVRHRAMGRFIPILETKNYREIINSGYNNNFQINNAIYLKDFKNDWDSDFEKLYDMIFELLDLFEDEGLESHELLSILPLAHQVTMHISGPITQFNYMNSLRVALGGDYGYRDLVYKMLIELKKYPAYSNMLDHLQKPDVNNVGQVLGRS